MKKYMSLFNHSKILEKPIIRHKKTYPHLLKSVENIMFINLIQTVI